MLATGKNLEILENWVVHDESSMTIPIYSGPSAADEVRRSIILDAKNRIPGKIYFININSFIDSKI